MSDPEAEGFSPAVRVRPTDVTSQVRWNLVVYEFLDNDQFSNLDTLLLQLAPERCLLSLDADASKGKPRGDTAKVTRCTSRCARCPGSYERYRNPQDIQGTRG